MSTMLMIKALLAIVILYILQKEHGLVAAEEECSIKNITNTVQELGKEISYAQWAKDSTKNVILSPLSIAVILNLLLLGTSGDTNLEIKKALKYPDDIQENTVHDTYKDIFSSVQQSGSGVEISLNTRIFPREEFQILESYTDISEASYFSEVERLDFQNSAEAATKKINNWVSESTKGKIDKLFLEPVSSQTVCVIANVIFLNATWKNQFPSSNTRDGNFYTGTETITIPMMNSEMYVPYLRNEKNGFEMISLPYVGDRFSMYILKPIGDKSLKEIENKLTSCTLNSFISQMVKQRMDVTIPRMKMSLDLDLNIDLTDLGIKRIFTENLAEFDRFTDQKGVFVSKIIHKAIIEVTESGTVAAAVTGGVIGVTSVQLPPPKFELNEPSLIFIIDNDNNLILFWGRVMKPEPKLD